jgi:hypothetical protein
MLTVICAWIAFAVVVGVVASMRGRVGFGWFLLALVISPLIVGPLAFALPRRYAEPHTRATTGGAIFRWVGITILFGGLVVIGMFVLAVVLIVQHGGA